MNELSSDFDGFRIAKYLFKIFIIIKVIWTLKEKYKEIFKFFVLVIKI